jgi:20S proteasome subunit beta 6
MYMMLLLLFVFLLSVLTTAEFEAYQLNGGLVSAVAGKDYCLLASDTRMMDGGYEIFTRDHINSRIWGIADEKFLHQDGSLTLKEGTEVVTFNPSTFVASAGCSADCEALKRYLRMDVKAHGANLYPHQVAALLSNTLYQRRGFPYYAFCVVAGCGTAGGEAYVYDAIGSYEQVAVASSGTGRELLQPILDRLFTSSSSVFQSGVSISGVIPKVVSTQVDCEAEEAVERIIQAYQAVTEREIGVGDSLVIFVTQLRTDGNLDCKTIRVSLKQH